MEKAERKQSHAGVFMAVAQVFRLLSLGQPCRMNTRPVNNRGTRRPAPKPWAPQGQSERQDPLDDDHFFER